MEQSSEVFTDVSSARDKPRKPRWVGQDRLYRWTMLRIRLNDQMSKEIIGKRKTDAAMISCLRTDEDDSIAASFLDDPGIEHAGTALQKKFGQGNGLLLNNFYFLFGIPRIVKIVGNAYKEIGTEFLEAKREGLSETSTGDIYASNITRRDDKGVDIGASRRTDGPPVDDVRRLGVSSRKDESRNIGASRRGDVYDDNRTGQRNEDLVQLRQSRRNDDYSNLGISRNENLGLSRRKENLNRVSMEYDRVIHRSDEQSRGDREQRRSRRREYDSGIEDALWQLDKTLIEHE